jgi:hypothetical protein
VLPLFAVAVDNFLGFRFRVRWVDARCLHTADAHDQRAASFRKKLYYVVSFGPVALFTNLLALFYDLGAHRVLSKSLNNMPAPQRELPKKAAKIIAHCKVVLGTSEEKATTNTWNSNTG